MKLALVLGCAAAAAPVAANDQVPIPSVDFEAEYNVRGAPDEMPTQTYIRHSGGWYRFDIEYPQPQLRTYGFTREGTVGGIFIFEIGNSRTAMRIASLASDPVYDLWGKRGQSLSDTELAGERCGLWRLTPDTPQVATSRQLIMCVAADAVPLYLAWEDRPKQPLLRAITVERRPQNPAWFTMPPGLKLRDVADLAAFESEVAVWAKGLKAQRPKR